MIPSEIAEKNDAKKRCFFFKKSFVGMLAQYLPAQHRHESIVLKKFFLTRPKIFVYDCGNQEI